MRVIPSAALICFSLFALLSTNAWAYKVERVCEEFFNWAVISMQTDIYIVIFSNDVGVFCERHRAIHHIFNS